MPARAARRTECGVTGRIGRSRTLVAAELDTAKQLTTPLAAGVSEATHDLSVSAAARHHSVHVFARAVLAKRGVRSLLLLRPKHLMDVIGFIGLGKMGRPMAANLCRKGARVVVYDVNPQP